MRLAYRYTSNPSEAEDVAQEALLRAWRRRSTLRDASRRKEWLGTIVRNEAFRLHARMRPDPVAEIEAKEGVEDERLIPEWSGPTSTLRSSALTTEIANFCISATTRISPNRRSRGDLDCPTAPSRCVCTDCATNSAG